MQICKFPNVQLGYNRTSARDFQLINTVDEFHNESVGRVINKSTVLINWKSRAEVLLYPNCTLGNLQNLQIYLVNRNFAQ